MNGDIMAVFCLDMVFAALSTNVLILSFLGPEKSEALLDLHSEDSLASGPFLLRGISCFCRPVPVFGCHIRNKPPYSRLDRYRGGRFLFMRPRYEPFSLP